MIDHRLLVIVPLDINSTMWSSWLNTAVMHLCFLVFKRLSNAILSAYCKVIPRGELLVMGCLHLYQQ
ncbi:hypothetical protein V5799_004973 [Amblyomma americanum]|uniref:Uncharacterized protein n=1 Tax=Amblyomma americanum TaxID=6943 RepID=A0AAQ4D4K7_AMBAM